MVVFEEMAWLFTCDNRNRGILRMNLDEAALLWKAVRVTAGPILEIGRRHGGSTALLCAASGERRVVSIDIAPEHHLLAEQYLARRENRRRLELIVGDSRMPLAGEKFGMAFIDGDHTYEGVLADTLAHWSEFIAHEGRPVLVLYHDAVPNDGLAYRGEENHCPGVRRLCEELVAGGAAALGQTGGSVQAMAKIGELPIGFPLRR